MHSDDDDLPEAPSPEEISQTLADLDELQKKVQHYVDVASAIDAEVEDQITHRPAHLDELPYGEELVRLRDAPEALQDAAAILEAINETMPAAEAAAEYHHALEIFQDVQDTLNDCTDLPAAVDEEEDY